MVDDGSTDNSANICQQFVAMDSRVVFLSTENQGPFEARKKGVFIAKGEYVTFVDADDYVSANMFNNNLGFYVGCLMWAAYIKTQPEQEILNNNCLGQEYNEEENISDTEFMIKFLELLPKDVKYFLGQNYEINQADMKILELYKEFLILNKGFVNSKNNTDIVLPNGVKTEGAEGFKDKIMEVIKSEDLSKLLEYRDLICQI